MLIVNGPEKDSRPLMPVICLEPLPPKTTKSEVIGFLCEKGGLDRRKIGRIDIRGRRGDVEVPEGWDRRLVKALDGATFGNGRVRAWSNATGAAEGANQSVDDHFIRLTRLLELESQAEARETAERLRGLSAAEAERTGDSLVGLVVEDEFSGLGGRFVVRLVKRNRSLTLPWNRMSAGSPIVLAPEGSPANGYRGVVSERTERFVDVAINEPLREAADQVDTWRVDRSSDEIARQRQRIALERARTARAERLADLRQVLLGERAPEFMDEPAFEPLDTSLNDSQFDAVRFAMAARDLALIHGPPGTGKTTAVVELIRQAVRRGEKVLACAPSNLAVDNIFERLLAAGERVVRLGHPARVLPELREHTLDLLVESHSDVRTARKLVRDAFALFRKAGKYTRAKPEPGARREMRQEAKDLLADARRMEAQAVESILNSADILCATITGLDSELLGQRSFDLIVIDEACQSTEPGCYIPLLRGQRLVLAGDHCQLPPTVVSRDASEQGYGVSLFERVMDVYGTQVARRLKLQYRMHESIMQFSSREFYDSDLEADASVSSHLLCDLSGVEKNAATESPVRFIDTAGAGFEEETEPDGESRLNRQEARFIGARVRELVNAGVRPEVIAVIAPYAAQVRLLRQELDLPGVEIDSVDGFQGREKEAVIISLVRSNQLGEIGFLSDVRRMNVAMTRARRSLLLVGDSATLSSDPFYQRLFEYFEQIGAYGTVWEENWLL
jgi:ATP-dependent RNA/DNA helicase IGHMBP2